LNPGSVAADRSSGPGGHDEESRLMADARLRQAIDQFNAAAWYECHDSLEEIWHETQGPMRPVLQGILQIAVAHLHLERGNRRGATVLLGEGVGRLHGSGGSAPLGLRLESLLGPARARLAALQQDGDLSGLPTPRLERISQDRR
jgi:predicted metal-dependent hydrolase